MENAACPAAAHGAKTLATVDAPPAQVRSVLSVQPSADWFCMVISAISAPNLNSNSTA